MDNAQYETLFQPRLKQRKLEERATHKKRNSVHQNPLRKSNNRLY